MMITYYLMVLIANILSGISDTGIHRVQVFHGTADLINADIYFKNVSSTF